jgi:hypothetical protein
MRTSRGANEQVGKQVMRTVSTGVCPNARLVSTKCHIQAVSAMVARGVRSRALRAHPFCDRLYSALVRYDDSEPKRCPLRVRAELGRGLLAPSERC